MNGKAGEARLKDLDQRCGNRITRIAKLRAVDIVEAKLSLGQINETEATLQSVEWAIVAQDGLDRDDVIRERNRRFPVQEAIMQWSDRRKAS